MDAAGSSRAALMGVSEGGPLVTLFAATYPERTEALIVIGGYASGRRAEEQVGRAPKRIGRMLTWLEDALGRRPAARQLRDRAPSSVERRGVPRTGGRATCGSRRARGRGRGSSRMNREIDVRPALEAIRAPTLIVHASGTARSGRHERPLPRAGNPGRAIRRAGQHRPPAVGDTARRRCGGRRRSRSFVTGRRRRLPTSKRHTGDDAVHGHRRLDGAGGSSGRPALARGDRSAHDAFARGEVQRARGRLVKTRRRHPGDVRRARAGDPVRARRCASSARPAGIELRAGLHTGECEIIGDDIGGIAVEHWRARCRRWRARARSWSRAP